MNLDVASRAIRILRILIVLWPSRLIGSHAVSDTVTGQTKLIDLCKPEQAGIRGSMRRMTCRAALSLQRSVFVRERPLLVGVALNAPCVGSSRKSGLLQLKTAVWIVAVTAFDHSFKDFVMERLVEVRFDLVVTAEAELRLTDLQ